MEVSEFRRIVRLGLGRAILHLRVQDDSSLYHAVILDACLVNDVYDRQMNANRGQYLFDLIQATNGADDFRSQLIADLKEDHDERRYYDVVPSIVSGFAQEGDDQSCEALYAALDRNPSSNRLSEAIVAVDGLDGLLAVARRVGTLKDGDDLHPSELYDAFKRFGKEPVWDTLDTVAKREPAIAIYASWHHELRSPSASSRKSRAQSRPDAVPYEEFVAAGDQFRQDRQSGKRSLEQRVTAPNYWGQYASEDDIVKAAKDLLAIPDQEDAKLTQYLRIFAKRRFPLDHQRLLQLVDHEHERVPFVAAGALRHISHPDVRQLAFRLRQVPDLRRRVWIDLLVHNYEPGDHDAIESSILAETDEEVLHSYGFDVIDLQKEFKLPELGRALHLLYERAPCAHCRENVVKACHSLETLPGWMIQECRFDSNLHLREFIASL